MQFRLWTHNWLLIQRPHGRDMTYLLWIFWGKWQYYWTFEFITFSPRLGGHINAGSLSIEWTVHADIRGFLTTVGVAKTSSPFHYFLGFLCFSNHCFTFWYHAHISPLSPYLNCKGNNQKWSFHILQWKGNTFSQFSLTFFVVTMYCVLIPWHMVGFLTHPLDKMAAISQIIFSDAFSWKVLCFD